MNYSISLFLLMPSDLSSEQMNIHLGLKCKFDTYRKTLDSKPGKGRNRKQKQKQD